MTIAWMYLVCTVSVGLWELSLLDASLLEMAEPESFRIGGQTWVQIKSIIVTVLWSGVVSGIALFIIDKIVGLRVSEDVEETGLDLTIHGEAGYTH